MSDSTTWTEADLADIDAKLKSGLVEVATADGKKVKIRTQDELFRLRAAAAEAAGVRPRRRPILLSARVRGE